MAIPNYDNSVFINCPLDAEYLPIFQAILFTLQYLEFTPRTAVTTELGGVRFTKIIRLIKECRFGIHDISRIELDGTNHLPRFNMPFELGLDIGCKAMCPEESVHTQKEHLILCKEDFQFQKYLSDMAGYDAIAHDDDPLKAITAVRDWLRRLGEDHIHGADAIYKSYGRFQTQLPLICKRLKIVPEKAIPTDFVFIVKEWLDEHKPAAPRVS